jgi:hypothetical protein
MPGDHDVLALEIAVNNAFGIALLCELQELLFGAVDFLALRSSNHDNR